MPEIMEIKKYCDFIKEKVLHKNILDINILNGRYKKHKPFAMHEDIKHNLPLKILDVNSKGKFIYITLEKNFYILNTLGLSGGWTFQHNNSKKFEHPQLLQYIDKDEMDDYLMKNTKHNNVEFKFQNGNLYFFDMLSFGTMSVINSNEQLQKKLNTLGPDILDVNFTYDVFKERILKKTNLTKKIGIVLMNQKVLAGIGNYIRADTLWLAKINPFRQVKTINEEELKHLFKSIQIITWGNYDRNHAIKLHIMNKTDKIPYDYKRDFFVYREEKDIYNNLVEKKELYEGSQKRFIYYCPNYQK